MGVEEPAPGAVAVPAVGPDESDREPDLGDDDSLVRAVAEAPPVAIEDDVRSRVPVGTVVDGNFRVEALLGAGAMGVVYEATDLSLDRRVALKLHAADVDAVRASRMWREARTMARLAHPNVVTVHEVGLHAQRVYIAMELVQGGTARDFLRTPPPGRVHPWRDVLRVFTQAAMGLAAAHAVGVVHRDFKPENILIGGDGRVRVADFGLAMAVGADDRPIILRADHTPSIDDRLTRTGLALGTPAYMAPEQVDGIGVDHRCDQFSFCVALFEALYGMRPFDGAGIRDAHGVAQVRPLPPETRVPKWLHAIVLRGLSIDPDARFAAMDDLIVGLRADPTRGRRRLVSSLGVGLALFATALATRAVSLGPAPCHAAEGAIVGVWSPSTAAALEAALRGTESPLAPAAIIRIRSVIDDYVQRWSVQRIETCEATRIHGTQSEATLDRRMACLEVRRQELVAVIDVLRGADADVVERTGEVLGTLGSIDACADSVVLEAGTAPPDDPDVRRAAEVLHGEIAQLTAQTRAGRAREIRTRAASVLERARALGHPPAIVDAELAFAEVLNQLSEHDPALAAYVDAHRDATRSAAAPQAWRAAAAIARLSGQLSTGTEEALRWLEVADGWMARFTASPSDRAFARHVRADVLSGASRFDDAAVELETALGELDGVPDVAQMRGQLLASLALAEKHLGRLDRARATAGRSLEILELELGHGHPLLNGPLTMLAGLEATRGNTDAALAAIERAVAIVRDRRGKDSLAHAKILRARGAVLQEAGRLDAAIADYRAALETLEQLAPGAPDEMVFALSSLASVLGDQGDLDGALQHLRRALDLAIPTFGIDSLRVAQLRVNLAGALADKELDEESIAQSRAALPLLERHLGPRHVMLVAPHLNLASRLAAIGAFDDAHAALDDAREILAVNPEAAAGWRPGLAVTRAVVFQMQGRPADAMTFSGRAVELLEQAGDPSTQEAVRARMRWGELLTIHGDPGLAIAPLRRAVADCVAQGISPLTEGRTRLLLAKALWAAGRSHAAEARTEAEAAIAILSPAKPDEGLEAARWLHSKTRG